ncbi:winged helix-turn-helix transcriptional regulator, partial [Lachnospiraceae bacterium 48-21]
VMEIAAALSRSPQTCKRSLNELEQAGMIMRVRQGIGEVSHMYILLPREDAARE